MQIVAAFDLKSNIVDPISDAEGGLGSNISNIGISDFPNHAELEANFVAPSVMVVVNPLPQLNVEGTSSHACEDPLDSIGGISKQL